MSQYADIVVLGAGGMLGTHVARALAHASISPVVLHREPRFCAPQQVRGYLEHLRPGVVVNCIGYLGTDASEHWRTNGCLPRAIADWCDGRAYFVHISTNAVFPPDVLRQWLPGDPIHPCTPYEVSKAFGEDPRAHVIRVSFVGRSGPGNSLWDRLRAGKAFRDAPWNGVTAWHLARRIVDLVGSSEATPRAALEHVHAQSPIRISELAKLLGSRSPCLGEADNARLLGGGLPCGSLEEQVAEYLEAEDEIAAFQHKMRNEA